MTEAQSLADRRKRQEQGKAHRSRLTRSAQAHWQPAAGRDPIALLEASNQGRLPSLLPLRRGRMLASPFAFLRGAAALMAADLAAQPHSGIPVQAAGDCHLLNFGLFATPERNLIFDLNDFDETHPAPWEWDVKRLATSFVLAGRDNDLAESDCLRAARECVGSYRRRLRALAAMSPLEVWYERFDAEAIVDDAPDADTRRLRREVIAKARRRINDHVFPRITTLTEGGYRILDQPACYGHGLETDWEERLSAAFSRYRDSLPEERRVLLDRYRLADLAVKVVGIGSVGTRCYVALLVSADGDPLILQIKQACRPALELYTTPSRYANQGERVVVGKRLLQASSDIFLGWFRDPAGDDYYVRQLRDMKMSYPIEGISAARLHQYADYCGWSLARAHARGGDAATIAGYLGGSERIEDAIAAFAVAYADQTEADHAALRQAVERGELEAVEEGGAQASSN